MLFQLHEIQLFHLLLENYLIVSKVPILPKHQDNIRVEMADNIGLALSFAQYLQFNVILYQSPGQISPLQGFKERKTTSNAGPNSGWDRGRHDLDQGCIWCGWDIRSTPRLGCLWCRDAQLNPQLFVGMIKFYASGSHQRIAIRTVAVLEQNEDFPCWTYIEPYKSRRA